MENIRKQRKNFFKASILAKTKIICKIVKQLLLFRDRNIKYRVVQSIWVYSLVCVVSAKASTKRRLSVPAFTIPKKRIVKSSTTIPHAKNVQNKKRDLFYI
jgi:hypothetical protein